MISTERFIRKLDECIKVGDFDEAVKTVAFWESEAGSQGDRCGLMTVLNEELGLFRRLNNKEQGERAIKLVREIIDEEVNRGIDVSRATVCVNLATTMKAFGMCRDGLGYYDIAERVYKENGKAQSYEFAALLNNKSSALSELGDYNGAEKCLLEAVERLKADGRYDAEIGLSYVNLANVYFDADETDYVAIENALDRAWEYINSERQTVRDSNYAFILEKAAPVFEFFGRKVEAEALSETAKEIYEGVR